MKKISLLFMTVISVMMANAKIIQFQEVATSINDWTISGATLSSANSDVSSGKYVYSTVGGVQSEVYMTNEPDVLFRYKNSSDKDKAFNIYPGSRFEFQGKNGVLVLKNTLAGDTITISVASKGSTPATFSDASMVYPINAKVISSNLDLPAKSGDYSWQNIEYVSLGGDVEIKEFGGGYAIRSIYIGEKPQEITIRVETPDFFAQAYMYAFDNNYNDLVGSWPGARMIPLGNNLYSYTFDASVTSVNIAINDGAQQYTNNIMGVTSSTCYRLTGSDSNSTLSYSSLDCADLGQPASMDTIVIRLDSYSVDWRNAYLYVWNGSGWYYYSEALKIVRGKQMTLADDGWWTYAFEIAKGTSFNIGFDPTFTDYPSYRMTDYSASACFTFENERTIQPTGYRSLVPNESNTFAVHVATAGTFGQVMVEALGELTWSDVAALSVSGSLNESDMQYFYRMTNLQQLNLSNANFESMEGCLNLQRLHEVILPSTCTVIANQAFAGCKRLASINLSNIQSIGNYAFYDCKHMPSLNMPNVLSVGHHAFDQNETTTTTMESVYMPVVQEIGDDAFARNKSLGSVTMPLVTTIGEEAFHNCFSLIQVDLSNVISMGERAFYMDDFLAGSLSSVSLSDELEVIPNGCFGGCQYLTSLVLPSHLKVIGNSALPYLTNMQLPEGIQKVGDDNFRNVTTINIPSSIVSWNSYSEGWQDVYCHIVAPPAFTIFSGHDQSGVTLHVPAVSLNAYKLHENWYRFGSIVPIDGELDNLSINSEFMLLNTTGIANPVDIAVNDGGALTLSASSAISADSYVQMISGKRYGYEKWYYDEDHDYEKYIYAYKTAYTGMLLANSAIIANNVSVKYVPQANQWNFFSLPFDVNMSDITIGTEGVGIEGVSQWVIREYSGANRASGNGQTWVNVPSNGMLHAHNGYILYWIVENSSSYYNNDYYDNSNEDKLLYYLNMPAANTANKQNLFAMNDVNVPLTEYSAEYPQNRSWNLIGNPYPCSFDIQQMDLEVPITVWNGEGYDAYTATDDDYLLRPGEAFFVQAPQGTTQATFHKEGRSTTNEIIVEERDYAPRRYGANTPARKVFNFTLSNVAYTDRARLVLNSQALAGYEINRDAAKMMSSNSAVPQLYLSNGGIRYSIDERPEQNTYTMGTYIGTSGQYTIHLDMPQSEERQIILHDTESQINTDLTEGDYTFTTEAGTYNNRFTISFIERVMTGIEDPSVINRPMKMIDNGQMIIISPQGKKYTVGGMEL